MNGGELIATEPKPKGMGAGKRARPPKYFPRNSSALQGFGRRVCSQLGLAVRAAEFFGAHIR